MAKRRKNDHPERDNAELPDQVVEVLRTNRIGYLSVISKSGELYSYPIAYYYSKPTVHFVTPVSAAKYKIIKNNPRVSFIVDNAKVTTEACGAMLQGRARVFTVGRTLINILSLGPKIAGFSRKYPGMLSFYARGKELPDERKLYKYRLIRITPTKIVYWIGYAFGRWTGKESDEFDSDLNISTDESGLETVASLLHPVEPSDREFKGHDWLVALDSAPSEAVSADESRILRNYLSSARVETQSSARVSAAEGALLKRSQRSRTLVEDDRER